MNQSTTLQPDQPTQHPRLLFLAGPIFLELSLAIGVGIFATWLISQVSDKHAAAFALSSHLISLLVLLFRIVGAGVSAVVANRLGASDRDGAMTITRNSFAAAGVVGVFVAMLVLIGAEPLLRLMRAPEGVLPLAVPYLRAMAFAILLDAFNATLASNLRAYMFARDTLKVFVVAATLQALLAVVLIPIWGLLGYVVAVTIAYSLALTLHLRFARIRIGFAPSLRDRARDWWRLELRALQPVIRIGFPAALENIGYRVAFLVSVIVAGSLGSLALSTQAYVLQINYAILLSAYAVGLGVEIVVGHMIGAKQFDAAHTLVRQALLRGILVSLVIATTAALIGAPLIRIFTQDAQIVATGVVLLWLNLPLESGRCFNLIVINALRAAGDARFPVIAGIWSMIIVLAGGSWLLGVYFELGLIGVWIAYAADEWVRGLMMWFRWKSRAWLAYTQQAKAAV
jgi:putative MATE family efflux protein